jgi:hypothetical protein
MRLDCDSLLDVACGESVVTAAVKEVLASTAVTHPATAPRIAVIKARLVELWPSSIIVLGVILTVVWNGTLLWLLMRLLSLF